MAALAAAQRRLFEDKNGVATAPPKIATMLVITERSLRRDTRLALLKTLLCHANTDFPVAAFFVRRADLMSSLSPIPPELSFDESRRARFQQDVVGPRWPQWPELPTEIADLTTIIRRLQGGERTLRVRLTTPRGSPAFA